MGISRPPSPPQAPADKAESPLLPPDAALPDDSLPPSEKRGAISVVPLAIPITVGPGTTGALLVMGAEIQQSWQIFAGCAALAAAVLSVGVLLVCASSIEHVVGKKGITILSKLTGLFVAALAAQIVFTGVRNFLLVK